MSIDTLTRATCDRCGATKTFNPDEEDEPAVLDGWGEYDGMNQCPECAVIVRNVLRGTLLVAGEPTMENGTIAPKVIP